MSGIPKTAVAFLLIIFAALLAGCWTSPESDVKRVDKDTVKGWLDDPAVMIIDVRASRDWSDSDKKIQGALRRNPNKVDSWAKDLPKDKKIVLYCA
jgi:rhodanese-related sulfurtransferase